MLYNRAIHTSNYKRGVSYNKPIFYGVMYIKEMSNRK